MTKTATIARRRLPVAVPVAVGLAWAAAIAAHATGFADRFHHGAVIGDHGSVSVESLAGFAVIWAVMIAAMMLPSAVPLFRLFVNASAGQERPRALVSFVAGYLAVWAMFGWVALALDRGVHGVVDATSWLAARPSVVGAATLALAGAFQFSRLKDRCLTQCRHPAAYLLHHYRRGLPAAFSLGWGHGLYCLGCCWALMLVMFAAGVSDLRWMAALGAVMAYEKLGRHGETVSAAVGVLALLLAVIVLVDPGGGHPPSSRRNSSSARPVQAALSHASGPAPHPSTSPGRGGRAEGRAGRSRPGSHAGNIFQRAGGLRLARHLQEPDCGY